MKHVTQNKQKGFTLIELMVTVGVMSIMASFAAPSLSQLLVSQRVRTTGYSLVSDLVLARSEALKRGASVTITPAVTSDWTQGWNVKDANAQVLSVQGKAGNGVQFTTAPTSVTFDKNGRTSVATVVRFGLYDGTGSNRCISLDPSGRPKSAKTGCPS